MTKREKKFQEIIQSDKTAYDYGHVDAFLRYYGFDCESQGSSHYIYRRREYPHITLVVHHNKVKRWYVKRAVQILIEYKIISPPQ